MAVFQKEYAENDLPGVRQLGGWWAFQTRLGTAHEATEEKMEKRAGIQLQMADGLH
jgi:hypothetical protein